MRRMYRISPYLGSFICAFLLAATTAFGQCNLANLNSSYCVDDPSFTLTGGTNYWINTTNTSVFNPATLGVGVHRVLTTNGAANAYGVNTSGTFSPEAPVSPTLVPLGDNAQSALIAIPFTFNFYGTNQTQLRIGSNGVVGFPSPIEYNVSGVNEALSDGTDPSNLIAVAWEDLFPNSGGTIQYFTKGTAPFRKFVIDFVNVPQAGAGGNVTAQLQLHETTHVIEIHTTSANFTGRQATQGIESIGLPTFTVSSFVAGRNDAAYVASNDYVGFIPQCLDIQYVTINALPNAALTVTPATTNVCTGSDAQVTIGSSQNGVLYQLRNDADDSALSGFFAGTGGNLTISSGPLTANTVINVFARNSTTLCDTELTAKVTVTVNQPPSVANAGADQIRCSPGSFTLTATAPVVGTGFWTVVGASNGAVITDPNLRNSTVTGLLLGASVVLRWTVSNGACTPTSDDVKLTYGIDAPAAVAGTDVTQCNNSVFQMAANNPPFGDGLWYQVSGPAVNISNPALYNTTVTGVTAGTGNIVLAWTIDTGCFPPSEDQVTIRNDALPTTANAGPDQNLCAVTSAVLAGNLPAVGTGQWTKISGGGGSFVNAALRNTTFNGVAGTTYVLRWTISNGSACTPSYDEVTIKFDQTPTTATAGLDQNICGTSVSLAGSDALVGTGLWTISSGAGGSFVDATDEATTFNGLAGTTYMLRWTINSPLGVCASTFEEVEIKLDASPTTADAGPDQDLCLVTSTTLAGNVPTVGSGLWTITTGAGGNIVGNTNEAATFNGVAGTTYVLRWTISNGICTASYDEVTIQFRQAPSAADAGTDIEQCNTSTFTLGATSPAVGTGAWSLFAGTATITNATLINTTVTGVPVGTTATLRWTVSNGSCATEIDDVVLTNSALPTTALAGADQDLCNTPNFTLAANAAVTGTGAWTVIGAANGAVVTTPSSATSTVTGLTAGNNVTLRWTITNGSCTSFDEVVLTNSATPTAANAGTDQTQCNTSTFTLAGNIPGVGTGTWTIQGAANGAVITNTASATTTVTGLTAGTSVTLRWTIANGSCTTFDDVVLTNNALPTTALAGADQELCSTPNFTLAANAAVTGTGAWTVIGAANGAVVTTPSSATSTVTGLTSGNNVTLRWTITNGSCTSFDEVVLTNSATPTAANAGTDQTQCNTSTFTLAGNIPGVGTGTWTIQGAANGAVITNTASATTTVTGLTAGTSVTLRWTIANGSCTTFDDVVLTNNALPTTALAGADQELCSTPNFTLAANAAVTGTGAWTVIGAANGAVVTTPSSATSTVTGLTAGNNVTLRWTITNGSCTSFDEVVLTNSATPTAANAGTDQTQCNTSTFTLAGNIPGVGTGTWTIQGAANGAVITNTASATTTVTGLTAGTSVTLRWTIANGSCTTFDDVVLTNNALPTTALAGADQELCNTPNFTLAANAAVTGTGAWTVIGAANGAVVTTPSSATSTVTGLTSGNNVTLRWTITNGSCTSFDEVVLTNSATPTAANAGTDQTQCNTSTFTLAGNIPGVGTGTWTIQGAANGAVITNTASATTTVTGLTAGTSVTLRWTIANGSCSSFDDVVLTNNALPTTALAGADQELCNTPNFTLAANAAVTGTGAWTVIGAANGAVVTTPSSATSTVTGLTSGNNVTLRWTITNGSCTSFDEVVLTNSATPTAANAGTDQTQCNTSTFTLAGNIPGVGTGTWTIQGAANGAVITNTASATTTVTGLTAGTSVTLRWTIANGSCSSFDDVVLTNNALPTTALAGADQELCNTPNFTLAANAAVTGTGAWTVIGAANGAVVTTPSSATSTVTGLTSGNNVTLRWTITNGSCTSFDEVVLTNSATPTAANAGTDQTQCNTSTFTLAGNIPGVGTGTWTIQGAANGAVITNTASATTTVTGLTAGTSVTLRWTIANGSCSSFDDVVLTNSAVPTTALAGADQEQCNTANFTLAGNAPVTGSGLWTVIGAANGAVITTPSSPTSTVTGLIPGNFVTLRWTITNGSCASYDEVVLTNSATPTAANAGSDQGQCNSGSFTLASNTPVVGSGTWTVVAGSATITNTVSPTTTVTAVAAGSSATLRWTITNGTCTSQDDVILTNHALPTTASAGTDQEQCNTGNFTLAGNAPVTGTGAWSVIGAANGASVTTPSSATSAVTGLIPGNSVTLRWTITNGSCASFDEVVLTNSATPTTANAGTDQTQCNTSAFTLAGNIPGVGTGTWTIQGAANGAVITNTASATTTVTGLTAGTSVTLRWTIANGSCTTFDDVVLTNNALPTTALAGADQELCNTPNFTLAANAAVTGTGAWTVIGAANGAVVTTPSSATSTVTGLTAGNNVTLRWTITNGSCTSFDEVVLTNSATPTAANAGTDQTQCNTSTFTLAGNIPGVGTGTWTIQGAANGAVITNTASATTTVTGLTAGTSVTLRWTITNGSCSSLDNVVLTNNNNPTATLSSSDADNIICPGDNVVFTAGGGTNYQFFVNGVSVQNSAATTYSTSALLNGQIVTVQVTDGSGCSTLSSGITTTVNAVPVASIVSNDADNSICAGSSVTFTATPAGSTLYTFRVNGATVQSSASNVYTTTTLADNNNVDVVVTSAGGCAGTSAAITMNVDTAPNAAFAGPDIIQCNNGSFTMVANAPVAGTTGTWLLVSGSATITNINLPTTTVTGVVAGAGNVILRWTISNGVCATTGDNLFVRNDALPTTSNAGVDQTVCGTSTSLNGNAPAVGTGSWLFAPGGNPDGLGVISDANSRTSVFTGTAGQTYVLRWRIANGSVCAASTDDVQIIFDAAPTVANAGADNSLCGVTSVALTGNTPATGTGLWTITSGAVGGESFVLNTNPTTTFNGVAGTTYVLKWTISNGVCASSSDEVTIRFDQNPSANAGSDIAQCNNGSFTLAATAPAVGTGVWTVFSGTATITNPASFNTTITGVPVGTSATLRWTVSNGSCGSALDDVVLTNNNNPTATLSSSDADNIICPGDNVVFTAGGGTNYQFFVNGVSVQNSAATTYSTSALLNGQIVTVQVTDGSGCSTLSSGITTTVNAVPVASIVSNDADNSICAGSSVTFTATPAGSTLYTFRVNGATVQSSASNVYTTTTLADNNNVDVVVTSAGGCAGTSAAITMNVDTAPNAAFAGPDIIQCNNGSFTMVANAPVAGTTGTWLLVSGSATITNINLPTTTVTGVVAGAGNVILRWTISNGVCATTGDNLFVRNDALPTTSNAGVDQTVCGTSTSLNGNAPAVGTGSWLFAPGGNPDGLGVISDANSRTSVFTGTAGQTYVLRWRIANGSVCAASTDDVQIIFDAAPTVANAGADNSLCGVTSVALTGNTPATGTGLWTITSGAVGGESFVLNTNPTTTFNGVAGTTYVLKWTISNGVCASSSDEVTIRFDQTPTIATAGTDQSICGTSVTLAANAPVSGSGIWTVVSGAGGGFVDATDEATVFNGAPNTTYVLRWTINSPLGICASSFDEVQIRFDQTPTVAAAGIDQNSCGTSAVLAGNAALIGSGAWSIISGSGGSFVDATDESTTFNGDAGTSYVLRWTITGVCASSFDEVAVTLNESPSIATAGVDENICNTNTTLDGNTPLFGTGLWTVISGSGGSFVDNTDPETIFNGASGTTYVLRWTISNGACAPTFDEVQIRFDQTPTPATAGVDQNICGTSATLAGNTPLVGTGSWSIISGVGGSFADNSDPSTIFTGADGTAYVLRWTITNGLCSTFDEVTIVHFVSPTTALAGSDQELCNTANFTLAANVAVTGTGAWTVIGAANGAVVTTPSSATSTVTGLTAGNSVTLRWTITNGSCTSFDEVVLTNSATPPVADAGTAQEQCNTSTFTLAGNAAGPGTGVWTIQGAASGAVITNINSATTTVTGLTAGNSVTLRWTITNGSCTTFDDVVLTNSALPTTALAGSDQELCNTANFTLAANAAVTGTGAWTVIGAANGAVVTTPSSATSTVTGLTAGNSVTLRWTITNGSCTSFDEVVLTNSATPPVADAGTAQEQCNTSTFTLAGNAAGPGTGVWTIQGAASGAVITNINSATTTVTGLTAGNSVTLRWTITNGSCTTFDDVVLTNSALPTTALAGSDQELCNTANFTLAANAAVTGTGAWTVIGAANGAVVTTPSSATSTVTGLTAGNSVTLRWTITNGSCTSFDEVVLTNSATPPVADAGTAQEQCNTSTFTLAGNAAGPGTGVWTIQGAANGAVITNINSATTTVTGLTAGNSVTLRWTITNGSCTTFDDVVLTNSALPTTALAGSDQELCNTANFTLAANAAVTGTGAWTVIGAANGAVVTTPSSATSTVTGLTAGNSVTLRWTITNGSCTSFDEVVLTNSATPPVADAGTAQEQCNTSTFTLAGNAAGPGTGVWTIQGAASGAVITNINSATTTVTGLTAGSSVTLRWTITNGSCTTFDDVVLTNSALPTTALAGSDQELCNTANFTLAANAAVTGTGAWTVIGAANGAVVTTPSSATSTVTGLTAGNSVTLRWTITNGSCTSFDEVVLTNSATPPVADAGTAQEQCNTSTFTLAGNAAGPGTGVWTIQGAASGAVITNINSATTTVTGLTAGNSVTLRWTITNGSCTTFDDVVLTNSALPTTALAGSDQELCNTANFTLAANVAVTGTGAWTVIGAANGAVVTTPSSATSTVTGLTAGNSVTLRWTITNGSCTSFDEVVLTNSATPPVADAGTAQEQCNTSTFTLAGNAAGPGTGVWTIQGAANGAVITNINSATTTVTGLAAGSSVTLRWTITNGSCTTFDDVVLTNSALPTTALAGSDQELCNTANFTLAANVAVTGTGAWTVIGAANGAVVTTPSSATSTVTGLTAGNSVTLRWTITNGSCTSFDEVVLTNSATPPVADAGTAQEQCNTSTFTLAGNAAGPGTGVWTIQGAASGAVITNINSATTTVTGLTAGNSVTLRWTITNGSCTTFDDVVLTNSALPTTALAGSDQELCNTANFTLAANAAVTGTGAWTVIGAANGAVVTTPSSATSTVTGLTAGNSVTLRWTITNGSCTSFDEVVLTNSATPPVADAGTAQEQCNTSTFTLAGNAAGPGTGVWTIQGAASGAVITNINSATTTVTGLTAGSSVTLRWTITNGSCTTFDDVVLTNSALPTTALAGSDQELCNTANFTLAANAAVTGTGAWTVIGAANGAVVTTPSSATSTVTGLTAGNSVTLRWTITNGSCTSFDEVVLTNSATPPVADAGTAQEQCNTSTFTLAGNAAGPGTGVWTIQGAASGAVITNINSATTTVTGLTAGNSVTLRWTITNGSCTTFDDVVLTNSALPTTALAGSDQELCNTANFTLAANVAVTGTGAWTVIGAANGAVVTTPSSATSTVTGLTAGNSVTLRWTITNGSCTSFDEVVLTNSATPPVADAGIDQEQCNVSTFVLSANAPTPGAGTWTIDAGSATITNINSPTTTVTGVAAGTSVTLRWTIINGSCLTSDVVVITNSALPTIAAAGPDQELCSSGNFTMAGNAPVTGAGLWTIIGSANGAVITTPASEVSTVTGLFIGSSVTLRWSISNGSCGTFDEVVLTNSATATTALAGPDQEQCNNSTFTLAANSAGVGTGVWTIQGAANGAVITNINSATTTVTGLIPGNTVNLRWTISNGSCISFDDLVLTNNTSPTVADAGTDQQICGPLTTLAANTPGVGAGTWAIISGAGGSVTSLGDPGSDFTGIPGTTYVLRWTVTNGICSSFDDVQIVLKRIPDVDASPETICSGNTTNIVITNPNTVPGTAFGWVVQGVSNVSGGSNGNSSLINQTLTTTDGITPGSITYRITPSVNGCSGTPLDITVTVNPKPVITTSASDLVEVICSEDALNFVPASTVAGTTFTWTSTVSGVLSGVTASGTGPIQDTPINNANTSGTITYTITPGAFGCAGNSVNYVVTVRPKPDVLATNQGICSGQSTSIAISNPNNVAGTTFTWVIQSVTNINGAAAGSGNFIGQVLSSADAISGGTVVYTITPNANGCSGDPIDVTITVTPVPVITNNAADFSKQICSDQSLNFLPVASIAGTTFSWTSVISGPVNAASVTASGTGTISDTPQNTGSVEGTVTYRITPQFNGCNGVPVDLVVTVKPLPSASGSDFTICSGQTAFITIDPSPKNVAGTTFSWTALPSANITGATNGNGSTINQLLTTTNALVGTVTYTITPFANGCAGPVRNIFATVNPIATVSAGTDIQVCEPASIPVGGTIGGSASNGIWSVITGAGGVSASVTAAGTVTATYTVGAADIGGSVVLRLTTDDPDAAGPCSIVTDDLVISVNRAPRVSVPADFVVCEQPSIPLSGDLDPSATAGSWSVLTGAGTLSVSSITGELVTANYHPANADIGNTVSFRLTTNDPDGFGPCVPAFDDINITINEAARVDAGTPIETCEDAPVKLDGSIGGKTTFVTWSGGSGPSRFTNVSDTASFYNLTAGDISAGSITLTLTTDDPDGAGPCSVVSDNVTVSINKLPPVGLANLGVSYAENSDKETLTGFPAGGVFTGPGILAGTSDFYPSNAGTGSKLITYTYTDGNGCTNSASQSTIVNPVTEIDFHIDDPSDVDSQGRLVICENSGTNYMLRLIGEPEWNDPAAKPPGAVFRSPSLILGPRIVFDGVNGYRINTKNLPGGTYTIEYIFTNTVDATDTLTKVVVVNSAPKAVIDVRNSCIEDVITYEDNSAIVNNLSAGLINKWAWTYGEGGNGNDGVSQNPTYKYNTEGFKTLGLRVTTNQGCQHDTTRVIRVSNPPKPDFTWSKICVQTETTEFVDLSNPGIGNIIQYAWDFNDGDTLGFGIPAKPVPANTHGGKTSNTYKNPHHSYDDFQVYNVRLTISTDDGCVNAITKRIFILDYNKPTPTMGYHENFENGKGTWVETSSHNDLNKVGQYSWVFGTPSGVEINSAYSGVNAWWTGSNPDSDNDYSTYYPNDSTEVTGPCLDLTGIERPMMSLNYWSHSQENFDGAVVQYSTNGGATWKTIGDAEKRGINWYNSKNIPGAPGGQDNFAWSGKTFGWKNARFNLDEIPVADRDLVVFRIAFGSNTDNLQKDSLLNGFAFDDVYIGEKKRTVLVEHFTNGNVGNTARMYLDNLYTNQTLSGVKTKSDFIKLQYHISRGGFDQINDDNTTDPAARSFLYGMDTPPATVMDGILGKSPYFKSNTQVMEFNGEHALINEVEIDRRALEDPKFLIDVSMDMSQGSATPLQANVTFTYVDSLKDLTTPVILHAALVEDNVSGNRSVLRKLLWGSGGRTEVFPWTQGTSLTVPINYVVDVPISDPNNLYLVVFAQDKRKDLSASSDFVLQSMIVKVPAKLGLTPVGIADNPFDAEIRDIHVYPNPASKHINFALENPLMRDYTYRIIDQRGITILEGNLNRDLKTPQQVELNVLSNGIYFVQFRTQEKVVVYKKIAVMNRH